MKTTLTLIVTGSLLGLSGCAGDPTYPKRFDTVTEVYGDGVTDDEFAQAPMPSKTTAVFDAPYADVFSVVSTSVTQNQWNVHSADEDAGAFLATRAIKEQFRWGDSYIPVDRYYHYFIRIDEVSGGQSQVRAVAKTQGECRQVNRGAMAALTIGLSELYSSKAEKECRDVGSKTMWAEGVKSVKSELDNLVIVIRNNLIALGYQ